ncbi:hypothetical protein [Agrobacterium burrii]|uniref:Uncharacterized protein n=1 Tax=Agrobacterium burrii TaxID=2815339 RepID=A0ABS3EQQ0_9HYPH|nr:hypothetical protein [Agrobacterium burrii]MBO0134244.1 hypothetical protein [Agrobacterium burrii]
MYLDRVHFDVDQRRREKQQDRDLDSARLLKSDGEAAKLSQQNGMFSAFKPAQMSIGQRRVRMQLA